MVLNEVRLYDILRLEDGRTAQVVELLDKNAFLVDVEIDNEYDTILVKKKQIAEIKPDAMARRVSQIRKWFQDDPTDQRLARAYALVERQYSYYWHDEDWYWDDEIEHARAKGKTRVWSELLDELEAEIFSRLSVVPPKSWESFQEYVDAIAPFMNRFGYTYGDYRWGAPIVNSEKDDRSVPS